MRIMKKLFLVCNAHLDPVWLWEWQEGATAAIATFRSAANFCEEYDGFVFCHNEALLYQWTEEYDPALFERIKKLVEAGKWHIIGGWFLQPDCNIPAGETIIRQIMEGQRYFKKHFGVSPKVAINFDTFGHSRGLVQILRQLFRRLKNVIRDKSAGHQAVDEIRVYHLIVLTKGADHKIPRSPEGLPDLNICHLTHLHWIVPGYCFFIQRML